MRYLKYLVLLAILALPAMYAQAQVAIGVQFGPDYGYDNPPPVCEFGYYPYYPFDCAPYGYWGPEWFDGGVFIGAGPWDHFYFRHPELYERWGFRGFRDRDRFWGRNEGFRGGFRGEDRFRGDRFRGGFRGGDHGFRGNDGFRGDRGFRGGEAFRGGDRGFRGGESFHGGGGFRGGQSFHGGGGFRGGQSFHGGGGNHGGGGHGGDHGRR